VNFNDVIIFALQRIHVNETAEKENNEGAKELLVKFLRMANDVTKTQQRSWR